MATSVQFLFDGATREAVALAETLAGYSSNSCQRDASVLEVDLALAPSVQAALEILRIPISLGSINDGSEGFLSRD